MADVNPENLRLKKDFLSYLKSVNRSSETIKVYESNLNIFFCWAVDNAANKFFVDLSKRDIVSFQNHILGGRMLSGQSQTFEGGIVVFVKLYLQYFG